MSNNFHLHLNLASIHFPFASSPKSCFLCVLTFHSIIHLSTSNSSSRNNPKSTRAFLFSRNIIIRKLRETMFSRRKRWVDCTTHPSTQQEGNLRNPKAQQKLEHKPFGSDHPKQNTPKWGRMRKNNRTNCGHWTTSSAECPTETESLSVE